MTNAITVPFHGNTLFVVEHGGQPYTPMNPIVEGMGLDWASQFVKLKSNPRWGIVKITIPTAGDMQEATCLPLRKLMGWLMTINPNKVKAERRGPAAIRLWASLKTRFGCTCKRLCRLTRAARVRYLRRRSLDTSFRRKRRPTDTAYFFAQNPRARVRGCGVPGNNQYREPVLNRCLSATAAPFGVFLRRNFRSQS